MWLIIALVAIWGTVLVAWLVSRVLAIVEARNSPTIRYRQSGSDVRKGTMALVFCIVVIVLNYVKILRYGSFIPLACCILFCFREMAIIQHIAYAHQIVSNEAIGTLVTQYSVFRCPYPKLCSSDKT